MNEEELEKIHERVARLKVQAVEAMAHISGLHVGMEALGRLNEGGKNMKVLKQMLGVHRDMALKLIECGQAMRRATDLCEPMVDDVLRGETPS